MPILQREMSLMEMVDEYRAKRKQEKAGVAPRVPQPTMRPVMQPQRPPVQYGNPQMHPGMPKGSDTVPAWLTPGENVVNAEASQVFQPQIDQMNQVGRQMQDRNVVLGGQPQGLNAGGEVKYYQEGTNAILGGVGAGLSNIGQTFANANPAAGRALGQRLALIGAGDLTGAANVQADFEGQKKKEEAAKTEAKAYAKVSRIGQEAISYLDAAGPALAVAQDAMYSTLATGSIAAALAAGSGVSEINLVRQQYVVPAIKEAVADGDITQQQAQAYQLLVSAVTALTTVALAAQGPGAKTDFDFQVAARETANLEGGTVDTIRSQLQRLVDNANEEIRALGLKPPVHPSGATSPEVREVKPLVESAPEKAPETPAETPAETPTEDKPAETTLKHPQDNPLVIPDNITKLPIGAYTAAVTWLLTQDLTDDDYVSFKGEVGTYKEFKES